MTFLTNGAINKDIKSKGKFCRYHAKNSLRVLDVFSNFPFTTSEMKRDY